MERRRRDATLWTRGLCLLAVCGPALALGGVHPLVVPALGVVVLAWIAASWRRAARWPRGLAALLALAAFTLLPALPMPPGLVHLLAPRVAASVDAAWPELGGAWRPLSVFPAATSLEAARLWILAAIVWAAAQMPWRELARAIATCGLLVLALGLAQLALDLDAIYGVYAPLARPSSSALLTSFVNPNHQAGLFLLSSFAAAALSRAHIDAIERVDTGAIAWAIASLALAAGVILSASRGAVIAGLVGVALAWVMAPRKDGRPRLMLWLAPAAIALGGVFVALLPGLATSLAPLTSHEDATSKFETAWRAMELAKDMPWLGSGRGTSIDLLALVGIQGVPVNTHLEVAPALWALEWGPVLALALTLGAAWLWWTSARRRRDASRLLLAGIAAWGVHNGADFNWCYLGTTAAAAAALGACLPRRQPAPRRGPALLAAGTVLALALAAFVAPRAELFTDATAPAADPLEQGTRRPLDPRAHLRAAREILAAPSRPAELERAAEHLTQAQALRPTVDAALLRASWAKRVGDSDAAAAALAEAWTRSQPRKRGELLPWLTTQLDPATRLAFAARPPADFDALLRSLRALDPDTAEALALARLVHAVDDPAALRTLTTVAMKGEDPSRALGFAQRWRLADPDDALAHATWARARAAYEIEDQPGRALELALAGLAARLPPGGFGRDARLREPGWILDARAQLQLTRRPPRPDGLRECLAEVRAALPHEEDEALRRRLRARIVELEAALREPATQRSPPPPAPRP